LLQPIAIVVAFSNRFQEYEPYLATVSSTLDFAASLPVADDGGPSGAKLNVYAARTSKSQVCDT
jgi:hypothetical protein